MGKLCFTWLKGFHGNVVLHDWRDSIDIFEGFWPEWGISVFSSFEKIGFEAVELWYVLSFKIYTDCFIYIFSNIQRRNLSNGKIAFIAIVILFMWISYVPFWYNLMCTLAEGKTKLKNTILILISSAGLVAPQKWYTLWSNIWCIILARCMSASGRKHTTERLWCELSPLQQDYMLCRKQWKFLSHNSLTTYWAVSAGGVLGHLTINNLLDWFIW